MNRVPVSCCRQLLPGVLSVSARCSSTMGVLPFENVKVVEMAGLAPVPLCGLVLADFGAQVTVVKKAGKEILEQELIRGKTQKVVDLKSAEGLKEVRQMCLEGDVLLDPFRPGVLEKLGLDPVQLIKENKKLVVARITGYGQTGELSPRAGHDINYVSLSGMMPTIGGLSKHRRPFWPPANLLADFAGGGLSAAFGVAAALFKRNHNGGNGGIIDVNMTEGLSYLASFITAYKDIDVMFNDHFAWFGGNSPFYRTYRTSDDKYMAVGAIEPKFTRNLFETLKLKSTPQDLKTNSQAVVEEMEAVFASKKRDEWAKIFEGVDACTTPVLEMEETGDLRHHQQRGAFTREGDKLWATPAPKIYTADQFNTLLTNDKAKQ